MSYSLEDFRKKLKADRDKKRYAIQDLNLDTGNFFAEQGRIAPYVAAVIESLKESQHKVLRLRTMIGLLKDVTTDWKLVESLCDGPFQLRKLVEFPSLWQMPDDLPSVCLDPWTIIPAVTISPAPEIDESDLPPKKPKINMTRVLEDSN